MRFACASGAIPGKIIAAALAAAFAFTTGFDLAEAAPRKQQSQASSGKSSASKSSASKSSASKSSASKASSKSASKPAARKAPAPRAASTAAENVGSGWRSGSAAIIVDANTGRALYEEKADELRHPASITKVMTLYLLFEQIEAGRLKLDSPLSVSARAAAQSPSKLNVKAGQTIAVEDAIKALVTRSANDVAVVIAENLGGSESAFADMMTRKARALGMSRTTFRNASGLPNPGQLTTARDLATLGMAIQDRFPRQYKYFATRTFYYRGEAIGNHNRLLGRMEGVDGIKTGYTRASGFNLLTSVRRDDKYIIGVVLGGASGSSRDARMSSLIANNFNRAYAGNRTAPKVVETADAGTVPLPPPAPERPSAGPIAPLPAPQRLAFAAADPVTTAAVPARSPEPIKPVAVKTTPVQRPTVQHVPAPTFSGSTAGQPYDASVAAAPAAVPAPPPAPAQAAARPVPQAPIPQAPVPMAAPAQPAAPVQVASAGPIYVASLEPVPTAPASSFSTNPQTLPASSFVSAPAVSSLQPTTLQQQAAALETGRPVRTAALAPAQAEPAARSAAPAPAPAPAAPAQRSGWMIQIGAFAAERDARSTLDNAQAKAKQILGRADPFTEKVSRGGSNLYRARFAGLDEKSAKDACRLLQRNDFACMTIRN